VDDLGDEPVEQAVHELDVKKALLAHPLVAQYAIAEQLLDRMAAEVLA